MRLLYLFCLLLFCSSISQAQDSLTITIPFPRYQIDPSLQLILIHTNLETLNNQLTIESQVTLALDQPYILTDLITQFKTDRSYTVSALGEEWKLYFTIAPILNIESDSDTIPNEPKTFANFTFIDSTIFQSNIGIELRGGTAISFPKKSYDIELWEDELGDETRKVSFLEMRKDDDWLLLGMYNEALRARNFFTHRLWKQIHTPHYIDMKPNADAGADFEYVELFLNGQYKGLYLFGEQIDRKQLQLDAFNGSIRGELYKTIYWHSVSSFQGISPYWNGSPRWMGFEQKYPKEEDIINWELLHSFVEFVVTSPPDDFYQNIQYKFSMENAVDFYLMIIMMKGLDNSVKNTYLAKDQQDGKYFYVPWDFDGVWGKNFLGEPDPLIEDFPFSGLWNKLITSADCNPFIERLKERWAELKTTHLSVESLAEQFAIPFHNLQNQRIYEREAMIWNGVFNPDTSELNYFNQWIENRFEIVDQHIEMMEIPSYSGCSNIVSTTSLKSKFPIQTFPNPSTGLTHFSSAAETPIRYQVFNLQGQLIYQGQIINESVSLQLPSGIMVTHFQTENGKEQKVIKVVVHPER